MKWLVGGIITALAIPAAALVLFVTILAAIGGGLHDAAAQDAAAGPSSAALADIPADRLAAYRAAADRYGIDWAIIAGIAKEECDHGRNTDPGCAPPGSANAAGAQGPFQFIATTWSSRYSSPNQIIDRHGPPVPDGAEASGGYATDCTADNIADPWDTQDAACAAARYLKSNGAPGDYRAAIWAYNHDQRYVDAVLADAARYRNPTHTGGSVAAAGAYAFPLPLDSISDPNWLTKPHHDQPAADIPVPAGTPIYAPASGTVALYGGDCGLGLGIIADDGTTFTICHTNRRDVTEGQHVTAGQTIGIVGWTGNVQPPGPAGAHLHFGITAGGGARCPQGFLVALHGGESPPAPPALPTSGCTY